ncbi:CrcB family protein [Alphaproteobacteria bacterium]|jgi:fluoride ion exporter CrcB/FEX|nr:CrcB family protein [Alphaproteobacteria bacterium]
MKTYLALVLGATIGSSIRYLFYFFNISAYGLPLSTIIVNILGSSLAGYFYGKFQNTAYVFMYLGIFGSLTTLSALNLELFELLSNKYLIKAIIYFFINIFLTFAFFYLFHIISLKLAS